MKRSRLHCGESLSIWAVVPCLSSYYDEEVDLDLTVDVHGLGTVWELLRMRATSCGRD